MKEHHLSAHQVKEENGWIIASAVLTKAGSGKEVLWYRLPAQYRGLLAGTGDPFVTGILFLLMREGSMLRVHGRVSPSLMRNLEEFQQAWAAWFPGLYRRVEILADEEAETLPAVKERPAIVAFSGGVDSAFTAYRHVRGIGTRFPRKLKAAVMVHGLDIPLEEPEMFSRAFERSRRMTESIGLHLIPMSTNFQKLTPQWTHSYGTALASCMMLLSGGYSEGLIGQGLAYGHYEHLPEGSNPLTDTFLSSEPFEIVPDGGGFQRADKIRAMLDWPEFLENMRICWRGPQKDRNCCVCEKCIRNILTFRALGQSLPACFPQDVSDRQIRSLGPLKEIVIKTQYDNIVKLAIQNEVREPWVKALQANLRRNRIKNRWKKFKVEYYLGRAAHYAARPSAAVFRLKHGRPSEGYPEKDN